MLVEAGYKSAKKLLKQDMPISLKSSIQRVQRVQVYL